MDAAPCCLMFPFKLIRTMYLLFLVNAFNLEDYRPCAV